MVGLKGSFQSMRSLNRSLILHIIRQNGPISRAEIARQTRLSPPAVGNIVSGLLDSSLICESKQGVSSGGRKPVMLMINSRQFFIIGLDIGSFQLKAVISDLNGSIFKKITRRIPQNIEKEQLILFIKDSVHDLKEASDLTDEAIMGIGIGMHGVVDWENGISLFAPNLGLRDIPLKEELELEFQMPVRVENDVSAQAMGELWFGNGSGLDTFVCINVGRGVGAGVIVDRKLHRGSSFISGEIGHMAIDLKGPKCTCGSHGCLQSFTSGPSLAEAVKRKIILGNQSSLSEEFSGNLSAIDGEAICRAAENGDVLSRSALRQAGRYLGIGITNLIHTINPSRIIIGGGVANAGGLLLNAMKESIRQRALTNHAKETEIELSQLGGDATVLGAVSLILDEMFAVQDG
ncbi:ROK family transcriptional regulator [Peribacillus kribbensis]|uniref:ROK family transcriptional regulator n=1 Tax=Peribacillus kribbensis TaxID=356658 RepID=UPI0004009DF2|nr:ROK family transcriptional regulator [Peribacillus kribbensis]